MSDEKPKKKSRWVKDSGVDRYPKGTELDKYRSPPGWHRGAKLRGTK